MKLVNYFVAETELIKRLSISGTDQKINFNLFSNLIFKPIGYDTFSEYRGFYIAINVLREDIDFDKHEKPGDFDLLIVPHSSNKLFFDRTCAIEVKVVRPTRKNPKKSPNSNGVTQVYGLVRDGFPFVGLIHICMTEPLLENEKQTLKFDTTLFDMDDPAKNSRFLQETVDIKADAFSWFTAENQMRRLVSKEIPKYIGLCTLGVNMSSGGNLITWFNHDFNTKFESGYFNPHTKSETIEKISRFWNANPQVFIHADV